MRPDAIGQAVEHRRDLDVGLQDPEAPLDVGQALVTRDHLGDLQVGDVGHQQQLAVEQFEVALLVLVDREAEGLNLEVDLDQVSEVCLLDRVIEARLHARV